VVEKVVTLELPLSFLALYGSVKAQHGIPVNTLFQRCLALDPGETTGWAYFDGQKTIVVSQQPTKSVITGFTWLEEFIREEDIKGYTIAHIRCEDYRVYEWKTSDHAWSPVHTLRWIGAIEVGANQWAIPLSFCMATFAKKWWTDEKLKHFGLYPSGLKHGKDALRHLLYYMLFPTKAGE
jgi:hypothetical protein